MPSGPARQNPYVTAPLGPLFVKTALPIIFVMSMSGFLSVVDAIFLGVFVGAKAVSAVTIIFPLTILMIALSTLVTGGMSSLLARRLGADDMDRARRTFVAAHGLALMCAAVLIAAFAVFGQRVTGLAAGGDAEIANMSHVYLGISVGFSPLMYVLSVNTDALRNEGRAPLMAGISLLVTLANVGFNYLLIGVFNMGVAGSAYGTAAAQGVALALLIGFRITADTPLPLSSLLRHRWWGDWRDMLSLGAPQSLSFLGLALVSSMTIAAAQMANLPNYGATIAAYGIITRIMGFIFLPLMGLGQAMQAIVGNNVGAQLFHRSDSALQRALLAAGVFCLVTETILIGWAGPIGQIFVNDPVVIAEVERLLPQMILMFIATGPILMLASYFQAIGDAPRAALLSLTKPFLFSPALIVILFWLFGERGIWVATPMAEVLMLAVVFLLLRTTSKARGYRFGLFLSRSGVSPGEQ